MARQTRLMISFVALAAAGALLAGCDRQQAAGVPPIDSFETSMGLDSGPPPPMTYGPGVDSLQPGAPLRVSALGSAPERYRYIDDAYEMIDAFGDSPPDYAFDYAGSEPWVWRSGGGYYRVVEAIPDGYREYYYGPQGDEPFLVRDPHYAYAYDAGALVAVYDLQGRVQPVSFVTRQADYAGRYYARARTLHYAALHQERRRPYADQWRARQGALAAPSQRWAQERERDPEWRGLRERRPAGQQAAWSQERQQRAAQVTRLAEQPHKPLVQARDQRRDPERKPMQARVSTPAVESRPEAPRAEMAGADAQQRRVQAQQAEHRRGDIHQAQQQRQKAQARPLEQAQAQQPHHQERAQAMPQQGKPQQNRPQRAEAPNAQAHGRPAAAQQRAAPTPHEGPKGGGKGGEKGGDKHDRR
jgi:hypothetical protein